MFKWSAQIKKHTFWKALHQFFLKNQLKQVCNK